MAVVTKTLRATGTNTSLVRASNVVTVTLTTASTPNVKAGDTIVISGSTATTDSFNGTFTVASVTSTTVFTYAQTGADETATAAGSSGGDYSLMSTWESSEQTNLVTATDTHELHCYDDWPSGLSDTCIFAGWTKNATYYATVKAATGHEVWWDGTGIGGGFWMTAAPAASTGTFSTGNDSWVLVKNIGLVSTNDHAPYFTGGLWATIWLDGVIAHSTFTGTGNKRGVRFSDGLQGGSYIRNCLSVIDGDSTGATFRYGFYSYRPATTGTIEWHNNTVILKQGGIGFETGTVAFFDRSEFINCVSYGGTGWGGVGTWRGSAVSSSNNAANDTTAPGTSPVTGIVSTDFVDYAGGNYRPNHLGALHGAGTDLSGSFTTDIRGEIYYDWSIGAYDSRWATKTLRSAGGDYTLGSTWESTEQRALTEGVRLLCYNDWSGNGLVDNIYISGWTGNSSVNQIMVEPAAGEGHDGVIDAGFKITKGIDGVLDSSEAYTTFRNIQVNGAESNTSWKGIQVGTTSCTVDRCIVDCKGYTMTGFRTWGTATGTRFTNNLVINAVYRGMHHNANNGKFHNCTVIGSGDYGIYTQFESCEVSNCVAIGFTTDFYNAPALAVFSGSTNASGDATAVGTSPVNSITSAAFKDFAGGDYRPAQGGVLNDAGTDLSGTFTDAIVGGTRREWDIGAYKINDYVHTLRSSGGDYSLMSVWESSMQRDLTAYNETEVLECYDDWTELDDYATINGWTADVDYNITVRAAAGQGHNGGGDGFQMGSNVSYEYAIKVQVDYTTISGFKVNATFGNEYGIASDADYVTIRDMAVYSARNPFVSGATAGTGRVWINCRSTWTTAPVTGSFILSDGDKAYNCSSRSSTTGFYCQNTGTIYLYNCWGMNASTTVFSSNNTLLGDSNANDTGAFPAGFTNSVTGLSSADFVDYAGGNYRPEVGGLLFGAGGDVSSVVTEDIRGETMTQGSIGPYDSDGFYRTLRDGTGDYSLMSVWESSMQRDLTATGDRAYLECYDDWPSGLADDFAPSGWTTSESSSVTIRAAVGEGHGGVYGSGFKVVRASTNYTIFITTPFFHLEGFTVENTATRDALYMNHQTGYGSSARNMIIVGVVGGTTTQRDPVLLFGNGTANRDKPLVMDNCLIVGSPANSSYPHALSAKSIEAVILRNLTIIKPTGGASNAAINLELTSSTYATIENIAVYSELAADAWNIVSLTLSDLINCASSDESIAGAPNAVTGITSADFVDYAGGDYRIDDTSALYGAGTDLTGTFTDDIRGTATRISTSPDIGAYKFDVITKTLRDGTGDYSTMSSAEANEQADLVANGERFVLECYDDWPSGLVDNTDWNSWVTDSLSQVTVKAAAGQEHGGVIGGGFWMTTTATNYGIRINDPYMVIEDLEIVCTGVGGAQIYRMLLNNATIRRCIARSTNTVDICFNHIGGDGVLENCLAEGGNYGFGNGQGDLVYIRNCTAIDANTGGFDFAANAGAGSELTNCLAFGSATYDFGGDGFGQANLTVTYCASEDTSATGTGAVTGITTTDFVDYAGGNYRPSDGSALAGAGTDLSAFFDDDITGTPR